MPSAAGPTVSCQVSSGNGSQLAAPLYNCSLEESVLYRLRLLRSKLGLLSESQTVSFLLHCYDDTDPGKPRCVKCQAVLDLEIYCTDCDIATQDSNSQPSVDGDPVAPRIVHSDAALPAAVFADDDESDNDFGDCDDDGGDSISTATNITTVDKDQDEQRKQVEFLERVMLRESQKHPVSQQEKRMHASGTVVMSEHSPMTSKTRGGGVSKGGSQPPSKNTSEMGNIQKNAPQPHSQSQQGTRKSSRLAVKHCRNTPTQAEKLPEICNAVPSPQGNSFIAQILETGGCAALLQSVAVKVQNGAEKVGLSQDTGGKLQKTIATSLEHAGLVAGHVSACSTHTTNKDLDVNPPAKIQKKAPLNRRFGYRARRVNPATIAKQKAKADTDAVQEQTDKGDGNTDKQAGASGKAKANSASENVNPLVLAVTGTVNRPVNSTSDCMHKVVKDEVNSSVGEGEATSTDQREDGNTEQNQREDSNTDQSQREDSNTDQSQREDGKTDQSQREDGNTDQSQREDGNTDQSDAESQRQLHIHDAVKLTEENERDDQSLNILPEKVFDGDAGCFDEEPVKKRRYYPRKVRPGLFQKKVKPDAKPPVCKPAKPVQKRRVMIDPAIIAQLPAKVQTRSMLRRLERGTESTEEKERSDVANIVSKKAAVKKCRSTKAAVQTSVVNVEKLRVPILPNFYDEASGKFHDNEIMEEFETAVLLPEPVAGETRSALRHMLEKPVQRMMLKAIRSERKAICLQKQREAQAKRDRCIELRQARKISRKDFPPGMSRKNANRLYYDLSRGKPYSCKDCGLAFSLFDELKDHLFQSLDARYKYKCVHCEAIFVNWTDMKAHAQQHMFGLPFKCSHCPATFATRSGVGQHFPIHTTTPHLCPHCGKSFTSKPRLQEHISRHTGQLRYKCQYCEKRFAGITPRRLHERVHTGEKPYKCQQCPYSGRTSINLKMHMLSHTGERPNPCGDCSFRGRNAADLRRHRRRMHKPCVQTQPAGVSDDKWVP